MLARILTLCIGLGLIMGSINTLANGLTDLAVPPEQIADEIIVFTPAMDMKLSKPMKFDRLVTGKAIDHATGKSKAHLTIVQKANTFIRSLEKNKPVRMYLKKYNDRDEYYPIAIFSISKGVGNEG